MSKPDKVNIHSELHRLIDAPPLDYAFLAKRLLEALIEQTSEAAGPAGEDRAWLGADLSRLGDYEPYEWGSQGVPKGKPVRYVAGVGFVVADSELFP
jgi:hypothetical protein